MEKFTVLSSNRTGKQSEQVSRGMLFLLLPLFLLFQDMPVIMYCSKFCVNSHAGFTAVELAE